MSPGWQASFEHFPEQMLQGEVALLTLRLKNIGHVRTHRAIGIVSGVRLTHDTHTHARDTHNTQHTTHNTQHTTHNTQHKAVPSSLRDLKSIWVRLIPVDAHG